MRRVDVTNRMRCTGAALAAAIAMAACSAGSTGAAGPADATLGMRVGGAVFDLEAFETAEEELGAELLYTVQFTGRQSQKDMNGSAFGLLASPEADLPLVADRIDLSISVPLGFGKINAKTDEGKAAIAENFELVIGGEYDDAYRRVAARLIEAGYDDAIVRLGHEFNGAWSPWSSRSNEELYVDAYRHVHDVLAAESDGFRFDWTAMRPGWEEWGAGVYPGDGYVDIVGMDIYWKAEAIGVPWSSDMWERDYLSILRSHLALAIEHDKPVSYPEWGLSGADSPAFIEAMHQWLSEVPDDGPGRLEYHAYFNTGKTFSLENFPNAEATYIELFGR